MISVGELDQAHCKFGDEPEWFKVVGQEEEEAKRWQVKIFLEIIAKN